MTEAANEAGGQAFATDYAGISEIMVDRFYREGRYDLDNLRLLKAPEDFLDEMLRQGFPRDNQTQALIRRHIPLPQAVLEEGVLKVYSGGMRRPTRRRSWTVRCRRWPSGLFTTIWRLMRSIRPIWHSIRGRLQMI